jgi:hypothetical protein
MRRKLQGRGNGGLDSTTSGRFDCPSIPVWAGKTQAGAGRTALWTVQSREVVAVEAGDGEALEDVEFKQFHDLGEREKSCGPEMDVENYRMSAVEEIKQACATRLTVAERAEVAAWLLGFDDEWDRQIEADAMAGKLDKLFAEADAEFLAGRCKAL